MSENLKKLFIQIIKFVGVGGICTVFEYVIFALMVYLMHIDEYVSQLVSFSVSTVLNYVLSMKFVFVRDENRNRKADFIIFVVLSLIALGLSELILLLFLEVIKLNAPLIVKLFATAVVMVFNFITRKIIYEKKQR